MPRKSRIDAAGALPHVIGRGIETRKIIGNDADTSVEAWIFLLLGGVRSERSHVSPGRQAGEIDSGCKQINYPGPKDSRGKRLFLGLKVTS
jgi:hypothetical protein